MHVYLNIFQGGSGFTAAGLDQNLIANVIFLGDVNKRFPEDIRQPVVYFHIEDGYNDVDTLRDVLREIDALQKSGNLLIACDAGLSRSVLVASAYIYRKHRVKPHFREVVRTMFPLAFLSMSTDLYYCLEEVLDECESSS